jgi:outer membrane protein OmpA-like peptidoglycan-associated protein
MWSRFPTKKRAKDEAEKPFWISYADLMTAMMMLFLVVMAFSLIIITNPAPENAHEDEVKKLCLQIKAEAEKIAGVSVDCDNDKRVDFGAQALFENDKATLSNETKVKLRQFVPVVYQVVNQDKNNSLLKQVIIEGYSSQTGSYLHNLQLSMRRAETVLCSLFEEPLANETPLEMEHKAMIRDIFLVGGYSSNNTDNKTQDTMRRVEFRLKFIGYGEQKPETIPVYSMTDYGHCQ